MITLGLDVSHYSVPRGAQHYDFARAHAQGARFAGVQLTVGTFDDAYGAANVKAALDAGFVVLPYAFLNNSTNGAAQADYFGHAVGHLPSHDRLYPILDIEPKEGATRQHVLDFLTRWFSTNPTRLGIYSGPGAFARCMGSRSYPLASQYPQIKLVWNADYRGPLVTSDTDPRFDLHYVGSLYGYGGWSSAQIVQDGPRFGTDGDAFAGTEAALAALFAGPLPPKPTVHYRFGAIPAWRGDYITTAHAPVRSAPGTGAPRVTTYAPGVTFHAFQSLTRDNGRRWLGNEAGDRWVLDDARVKKA